MALAITVKKRKKDGLGLIALVQLTASGSYSTGGDSADLAAAIGYTNRQPDFVSIKGIAGYVYEWDGTNKTVIVRQSAGFTPAGTISKPSFTVKSGTILTDASIGLTADAVNADVVAKSSAITTDRTLTTTSPVGTPTLSGSAVAAAALAELPATTYPSGVTGDTILAKVEWIAAPQLSA